MNTTREIEIFSAGCPACEDTIALVKELACSSCEVKVLDMQQKDVAEKAKLYGIQRVPAVVVDGKLANCCSTNGLSEQDLRSTGIGSSLTK